MNLMRKRKYFYLFVVIFFIAAALSIAIFLPVSQAQSATRTPRPTRTPRQSAQTYYVTGNAVNARSCPRTDCEIVTTFSRGRSVRVLETVTGSSVSGNTNWYRARYQGQDIFIHSSLLSRTQPSSPASPQPTRTTNSGNVQPTNAPAAPVAPPPPPTENQSVAPPAASFTCSCSKTCEQIATCEEAYFQLNQCGCSRRDSDGDGVPCESICSGG